MTKAERAVTADLSEKYKCDSCQNIEPKPILVFDDKLAYPRGMGGRFCKPCARSLLSAQLLREMPDVESAKRSYDLGTVAQRHYRDLQNYANEMAAALVDGKQVDLRMPGFDREEMRRKAQRIVNKPAPVSESHGAIPVRAEANPQIEHVDGGRFVSGR